MSLEPPRSPPGAPEDDTQIVDGLELAVAQARTKIPDHENDPDVVLPTPRAEVAPMSASAIAVDSSAVMEVLRGAIARYTTDEAKSQGTWSDDVPLPVASSGSPRRGRHAAAGYEPDRRRLAAAVVVLFLLIAGVGYQQFGVGKSTSVKTAPQTTVAGHVVTTLARLTTTLPVVSAETAPPETAAPPAATSKPNTTVKRSGTTAPPATDPPSTEPPPSETSTSTTNTTTTTTTVTPCTDPPPICP